MLIFQRSVTKFSFRNCTHILTRTQGKKFVDMFLVKIASEGTSLKLDYANFGVSNLLFAKVIEEKPLEGGRLDPPPPW